MIAQQHCYGKALIGFDFDLKLVSKETDFGAKFFFMNETEIFHESNKISTFHDQTDFSLSRSKRIPQGYPEFDQITGSPIIYCNGVNACGDVNFLAAICSKDSCGTLFCLLYRRNDPELLKRGIVSWDHIIKQGYWCLPCCILENVHPEMSPCSAMRTEEDICKQRDLHGTCGIQFHP